MHKKIFFLPGFLMGMLATAFINVSECPAQGVGGAYDTRAGKLTVRSVDGANVIELNEARLLEGKIRQIYRLTGADVAVVSAPGNVNCPAGFNFVTLRQYEKPQVSDWIPACYDAEGDIRQEGQDIVLKLRESVGTDSFYRYSGGSITKTVELKKVRLTDEQCRIAYNVYREKCKGLSSALVIDRHLYFYKDALDVDQFFGLCQLAGDDTWTPVSYGEFKNRACKMQD
ncbi:MAG TPA: hypothetical protein PLR20_07330 [Syntrophales bacterium]|nr:hypothetical protein [Syntrophales bacterium]HOX94999.1 hypothetical protein [Syntrophales bacterium]HPI56471.1 hypothetical protein [Syntrophales bacterium]HPN25108.1 hypothetical protein [Syntrophales bacterium]HQM29149.1 hypothetical protein [Syntrophales bacterium]